MISRKFSRLAVVGIVDVLGVVRRSQNKRSEIGGVSRDRWMPWQLQRELSVRSSREHCYPFESAGVKHDLRVPPAGLASEMRARRQS